MHKDSGDKRLKNLARYVNSGEWSVDGFKRFGTVGDIYSALLDNPDWDTAFHDRSDLPDEMPFVRTVYGETSPVEQFAEAMSALLSPEQSDDDLVSGGLKGIITELLELDSSKGLVEQLQERQSYTPQARVEIEGFASRGNDVLTPAGNKDKWHPIYKTMDTTEMVEESIPVGFDEMIMKLVSDNQDDKVNEGLITPEKLMEFFGAKFGTTDPDELASFFDFQEVARLQIGQKEILDNNPAFFRHHQMYGTPQTVMLSDAGLKRLEELGLKDFNGAYLGFKELNNGIIVYPPNYLTEIRQHQREGLVENAPPSRAQRLLSNFLRWSIKHQKVLITHTLMAMAMEQFVTNTVTLSTPNL